MGEYVDLFGEAIDGELHRMPTRQERVEWLALLARELVHTVGALGLPEADSAILAALAATRIQHAGRVARGDIR